MNFFGKLFFLSILLLSRAASAQSAALADAEARMIGAWEVGPIPHDEVMELKADHSLRMHWRVCNAMEYLGEKRFAGKPMGRWHLASDHELVLELFRGEEQKTFNTQIAFASDGSIEMLDENGKADVQSTMRPYTARIPAACSAPDKTDEAAWDEADRIKTLKSYNTYLHQHEDGFFVMAAVSAIRDVRQSDPAQLTRAAPGTLAAGNPNDFIVDVNACRPQYSPKALKRFEEGQVKARVSIRADASLATVEIIQSSGFDDLDQATLDSFKRCKFKAGKDAGGHPIPISFVVPFDWVVR